MFREAPAASVIAVIIIIVVVVILVIRAVSGGITVLTEVGVSSLFGVFLCTLLSNQACIADHAAQIKAC